MCQPPSTEQPQSGTKKVVIVGAGPAGLLASILFLRRNINQPIPKYQVTLIDPGTNYGKLSSNELQCKRSWMIGLSAHGLKAIQSVDGLYENYIHGLGIDIQEAIVSLNKHITIKKDIKDLIGDTSAFTVDRNFICAGLARYLNDKYDEGTTSENVTVRSPEGNDVEMPEFISYYDSKALFVDYDQKQVLVRQQNKDENNTFNDMYLDYDLIIGCDGIRSIVRNAIASTNRDFEFSIQGTFGKGKAFHVDCPPNVKEGTFFLIINAIPNMTSFTLPETNGKLNVNLGYAMNKEDEIDPILKSDDVVAISAYFRKHFHAFDLDCDDAAKQWVSQTWNTISQVHCNIYHDRKRHILLMGDAAHATSPQIGQGMNTALADAAAFDKMLDDNKDDIGASLEMFSKERVKEGNALTDLSFYTMSLSPSQQFQVMAGQLIRAGLHRCLPRLFNPDPMDEISKGGKLSVAYEKMSKLGVIQKIRLTNDTLMREHFEKTCGMTTASSSSSKSKFLSLSFMMMIGVGVAALGLGTGTKDGLYNANIISELPNMVKNLIRG
jgi:2-polyprenyl-6-methoxyphenol hydroxylase-like FAD-dependent oxidoreductase